MLLAQKRHRRARVSRSIRIDRSTHVLKELHRALIAVRGLLKFIANHSYAAFAWDRIAFGLLILATWLFGWVNWTEAAAG